jgi:hypothetical protein
MVSDGAVAVGDGGTLGAVKYVVLAVALLALIPFGIALRGRTQLIEKLTIFLGMMLWTPLVTVNIASHETYRGVDRGFEFTSVDLLVWMMWVALPPPHQGSPFRKVQILFLVPCVLSIIHSEMPLYVSFSLWKLVRMLLFVAAVWRIVSEPARLMKLVDGLCVGLIFQAFWCAKLRYVDHHHQISGVFSHQNSLGMAVNLVLPIVLARFMYTGSRLAGAALAAGALCIVFTLSRGSMTMMIIGLASVYFVSMLRGITTRKLLITVGGVAGGVVLMAKSLDTIVRRFENAPETSAGAREKFKLVADMMVTEHPWGIGMNMYSWEIQHTYGPRLGLEATEAGVAHHVYWLTTAECGWFGIVAYVFLLAVVYLCALRAFVAGRRDYRGQLAVGCLSGLTVMYMQGTLEWVARQTVQSYLFWIVAVVAYALLEDLRARPEPEREIVFMPEVR